MKLMQGQTLPSFCSA